MGIAANRPHTRAAPLAEASSMSKLASDSDWRMLGPNTMKPTLALPFVAIAMAATLPTLAHAASLKTMPHGVYECAYPGDASGLAWLTDESAGFILSNASSYRSARGSGTYLLKGKELTFTRGPKKGERYRRSGNNELVQVLADGSPGKLRCFRIGLER